MHKDKSLPVEFGLAAISTFSKELNQYSFLECDLQSLLNVYLRVEHKTLVDETRRVFFDIAGHRIDQLEILLVSICNYENKFVQQNPCKVVNLLDGILMEFGSPYPQLYASLNISDILKLVEIDKSFMYFVAVTNLFNHHMHQMNQMYLRDVTKQLEIFCQNLIKTLSYFKINKRDSKFETLQSFVISVADALEKIMTFMNNSHFQTVCTDLLLRAVEFHVMNICAYDYSSDICLAIPVLIDKCNPEKFYQYLTMVVRDPELFYDLACLTNSEVKTKSLHDDVPLIRPSDYNEMLTSFANRFFHWAMWPYSKNIDVLIVVYLNLLATKRSKYLVTSLAQKHTPEEDQIQKLFGCLCASFQPHFEELIKKKLAHSSQAYFTMPKHI
ncbi:hypothetical protein HELRODRAFT_162001 [Helobdella robusta]|uniref:Uncharacterized protein n=1 Tax=Helobdella robusta TaxID=6412 RepID=T1ES50_HELRO|nr:hypothetical protein HELRODRAFT_162001 [Helobdella robusta]ESO02708.1 hypothetical protein HELRODRAFT_162001 [Helobdella robusta]